MGRPSDEVAPLLVVCQHEESSLEALGVTETPSYSQHQSTFLEIMVAWMAPN